MASFVGLYIKLNLKPTPEVNLADTTMDQVMAELLDLADLNGFERLATHYLVVQPQLMVTIDGSVDFTRYLDFSMKLDFARRLDSDLSLPY